MNWIVNLLFSSIGKKLIMSLTGLFLILFLVIHLIGNLQLLYNDGGESFNSYTYLMTHNPLIKFVSYGLYTFILLHAVQGVWIGLSNLKTKGQKYAVKKNQSGTWASRNMLLLGILVFAFLLLHMGDFWYKMKVGSVDMVNYESLDYPVKDLYSKVEYSFSQLWIVIAYLIGLLALGFHLIHGFTSAFQTLGLRHNKYTPIINTLSIFYTVVVILGFAIIPIYFYFIK